jgi:two-component system, cell cycle sensor histidine kinase and response regulator CckA
VDDEPTVLRLVARALAARGYDVHPADGPLKALKLVEALPCFDLVVSDVIMPEICGPELIRRLRQFCPDIAVVLMSGHIAFTALPNDAAFIGKPFVIADLYSVVEKKCPAPPSQADSA